MALFRVEATLFIHAQDAEQGKRIVEGAFYEGSKVRSIEPEMSLKEKVEYWRNEMVQQGNNDADIASAYAIILMGHAIEAAEKCDINLQQLALIWEEAKEYL